MYYDKLSDLGIRLNKKAGTTKVVCPQCSHRRKKTNDPCLNVNIDEGWYKCHNDDCNFQGTVNELKTKKKKDYKLPSLSESELSTRMYKYVTETRAISDEAIARYKITESKEWYPQLKDTPSPNRASINFNYFRNEQLINVKYRNALKHFKMAKDAELILYGLDFIKNKPWFVLTEGEFDALSYYTAGIYNAGSVPNGSPGIKPDGTPAKMDLVYLDNCYEEIKDAERIYLSFDTDVAGQALLEEVSRRVGRHRVWIIDLPEGCKDANDVIVNYDGAVLKECFENARPYPVKGIETADDVWEQIEYFHEFGFPEGEKLEGMKEQNEHFTWSRGELTLITGAPGHGKSNWLDQQIADLAKQHDWKFGIVSNEKDTAIHNIEIIQKTAHGNFRELSKERLGTYRLWLKEHFEFINDSEVEMTMESILGKAKELVERSGIDCFILDNWSYVESKLRQGENEHNYVGRCMSMIRTFCKVYDCAFILVAHPKKPNERVTNRMMIGDGYIVSGSSHFFNKIDNGVTIHRDFEENITTARFWKIRWWFIGKVGFVDYFYNLKSWRYEIDNSLQQEKTGGTLEQKLEKQKKGGFSGQPDYTDL